MMGCLDRTCKAWVLELARELLVDCVKECTSEGGSEEDCLDECMDSVEMALGLDTRAPAVYEC